jgi:hypothetical protein
LEGNCVRDRPEEQENDVSVPFHAEKMGRLLSDLLGRPVSAKIGPVTSAASDLPIVASYAIDNGDLAAVCICDLEFALNGGAALCLIPACEAATNLKTKHLDPLLFGGSNTQRVKLVSVHSKASEAPETTKRFMEQTRMRREAQISIAGYGEGRITVFC